MKLIISILILVFSAISFAGSMSTVDLLVREAASNDFGGRFYDEWVLSSTDPIPGCLMTVKAKTSSTTNEQHTIIEGTYCVTRDENNSIDVNRVIQD